MSYHLKMKAILPDRKPTSGYPHRVSTHVFSETNSRFNIYSCRTSEAECTERNKDSIDRIIYSLGFLEKYIH